MSDAATLPLPSSSPTSAPKLAHGNSTKSIGNSYIAGEGVCQDGEVSNRCFLQDNVRDRLYTAVEGGLSRMASMVSSAVNKLQIAELVKKPEDLDPITEFLIDAATAYLGKLAGKAIKMLRGSPAKTLIAIGVGRVGVEDEDHAKEADEGVVALAIKGASSLSKKGAGAAAKEDTKAEYEADKVVAMNYLSMLEDGAYGAINGMSKQVFGSLGDADRILLYLSLDQLKPSEVLAEIAAGLARYKASPASKIGRTLADRHMEKPEKGSSLPDAIAHQQKERADKKFDNVNDVRSIKLVQQVYGNGEPPRLYYYKRDFDGGITRAPGGDVFLNTEVEYPEYEAKDDQYVMYKEVEPEFMQLAIANNIQQWNKPYEVKIVAVPDSMKDAASHKPPASAPARPTAPLDARPPA